MLPNRDAVTGGATGSAPQLSVAALVDQVMLLDSEQSCSRGLMWYSHKSTRL